MDVVLSQYLLDQVAGDNNITIAPDDADTKKFIELINQEFQFDSLTFNFMEVWNKNYSKHLNGNLCFRMKLLWIMLMK